MEAPSSPKQCILTLIPCFGLKGAPNSSLFSLWGTSDRLLR
uniref:Uncharacterized protein n=1 Tax=Nelumbo nucifera TaxID=4432 RepID=A0A822ZJ15_NELNU|nr:TPA_asm: hypothetical protein HUJ06_003097 [Nelumbo nucifera]